MADAQGGYTLQSLLHTGQSPVKALVNVHPNPSLASLDVNEAWTGTFGAHGLRAVLTDQRLVTREPDAAHPTSRRGLREVKGVVLDSSGAGVGKFGRTVLDRTDGSRWVEHDGLYLDPDHRGTGFATEFNRHAERFYREWGVGEVRVTAVGGGPYPWARQGFDFEVPGLASDSGRARLERARIAADMVFTAYLKDWITSAEFAALRPRLLLGANRTLGPETLASSMDVASLPGGLGRRILTNQAFRGVKLLEPAAAG